MTLVPIVCPYCNAANNIQVIERTVTDKLSLKLFAHEATDNQQIIVHQLKCRLCLRKYELISSTNYAFIKANLLPSATMLDAFKTYFQNYQLDSIFAHITGLARPEKELGDRFLFHSPHLHVCFELDGKRAYVDCEQITGKGKSGKTILRGLNIIAI